jgi:hypothetical protein
MGAPSVGAAFSRPPTALPLPLIRLRYTPEEVGVGQPVGFGVRSLGDFVELLVSASVMPGVSPGGPETSWP